MSTASLPRSPSWTATTTTLAILIATAAWTLIVSRWMLADVVVPWDSKNHFYPMLRFLSDSIHDGEVPLWNPYHFSGFPTVADPQSLLFIPTMLLFAVIDGEPTLKAFDFVIFLHLLMAMLGVVFYFRFKRWHPSGAIIAALVFAFGGSAAIRLQHTGMIISYAFFPLALLFLEVALDRRSYAAGIAFAVAAAFMALGRDQVAFMLCLTLIAIAVVKVVSAREPLRFLLARLPLFLVMGVIGAAILAIPALLTLQLLTASNRPEISYGYAIKGSLHPINLVTLLAPDFFGALSDLYNYRGPSWGTTGGESLTDPSINQIFIGTLPVLFVLWHGIAGGRAFERPIRFFTILLGVTLIYAFGRYTPIFEYAFDWIPGVNLYRRPADATFMMNVAFAFLSGYLVHRWVEEGAPKLHRVAVAVLSLGVVALFAAALFFLEEHSKIKASGIEAAIALALFALGGLLLSNKPATRRPVLAALVLVITVAELGWRHGACSLNAEPKSYYAFLETPRPVDEKFLEALDADIERRQIGNRRPRVEMIGIPGPWMNSAMVYGFESTVGYNPLRLEDYQRAVGPGENCADINLRSFPPTFRGYRSRLARLLGIEYVAFDRPLEHLPKHFPKLAAAEPFFTGDHLYVYRLPPAAPRAYIATRVRTVDSEDLLLRGEIPDFDVANEALIDDATVPRRIYAGSVVETHRQVDITDYRANEVTLSVDTDVAGTLVLHDIYYPGWVVEVDGRRQPVLRANLLFRGVEIKPGHHTVVFSFRPLSLENLRATVAKLLDTDQADSEGEEDDLPVPPEPLREAEHTPGAPMVR